MRHFIFEISANFGRPAKIRLSLWVLSSFGFCWISRIRGKSGSSVRIQWAQLIFGNLASKNKSYYSSVLWLHGPTKLTWNGFGVTEGFISYIVIFQYLTRINKQALHLFRAVLLVRYQEPSKNFGWFTSPLFCRRFPLSTLYLNIRCSVKYSQNCTYLLILSVGQGAPRRTHSFQNCALQWSQFL